VLSSKRDKQKETDLRVNPLNTKLQPNAQKNEKTIGLIETAMHTATSTHGREK
jgi:hypothetical protein